MPGLTQKVDSLHSKPEKELKGKEWMPQRAKETKAIRARRRPTEERWKRWKESLRLAPVSRFHHSGTRRSILERPAFVEKKGGLEAKSACNSSLENEGGLLRVQPVDKEAGYSSPG